MERKFMNKFNNYSLSLIFVFILGSIWPFFPSLTVLLVFYLLIPIGLAILITSITLLIGFVTSDKLLRITSLKVLSALLIFNCSQLVSVFMVDTILNYKSGILIRNIEDFKVVNNKYPTSLNQISDNHDIGIVYHLNKDGNYELEYSRGFMVREVYSNTDRKWESLGWND